MLLDLQKGIIYGPVNSRRLGRSLGINIMPSDRKVCSFNCVYCQYGWTKVHTAQIDRRSGLPTIHAVKEALKEALRETRIPPASITFSGNGEPALHPDFGQIIEEITAVRDQLAPEAKTAVISNSALVTDISVRKALPKLDMRIMKLDCGLQEIFFRYNQPCKDVNLEAITKGLAQLKDVTIQTLISSGQEGNLDSLNITSWIERLKRISPLSVQLYTLDRGYPDSLLKPATKKELSVIKAQVEAAGLSIHVF